MSSEHLFHQVLYITPHTHAIRCERVELPEINARILFTTPRRLRERQIFRGVVLCHVAGEDHLDSGLTEDVRSRLRQPEHDCPARGVDFSHYLWFTTNGEQR